MRKILLENKGETYKSYCILTSDGPKELKRNQMIVHNSNLLEYVDFSSPERKYRKSYCNHPGVGVGVRVRYFDFFFFSLYLLNKSV